MATRFTIDGKCPTKGSTKSAGEPDMSIAMDYMRGLIRDQDPALVMAFIHEGAPVSKSRARWNRRQQRFYTPQSTQDAEAALSWRFREVVKDRPLLTNVALVAVFYRPNHQRIDADNLMKLVMDSGTKAGVWKDDCQVTHQLSVIEKDAKRPRTVVALCPVVSSLDRSELIEFTCERCGKEFSKNRAGVVGRVIKYCSAECRAPRRVTARCPKCDKEFDRQRSGQRYCSNECRLSGVGRRKSAAEQRPPAVCSKCGERVSRREYLFCANCRRKGRKPGSKNRTVEVA